MVTMEKILQTMKSWQWGEVIAVRRKKCLRASSRPSGDDCLDLLGSCNNIIRVAVQCLLCTQLSPPISPQPSIVVPPSPHFISGCQYWCWCQQGHFTFTLVTPDIFIMSKLSGVEHSWFSTFQCWSPLSTAQLITSKWKFGEYQLHSFSVMVFWCKQDSATFDISKHSWLITQIPLKLLIDVLQARFS